jgi:hypothetical protein
MRLICLFFIGIFFSIEINAQNFNYTFSSDSVAWNELSSQTILNTSNSAWNFAYKIPIGFTFNYLGRNFDSLRIETNGYVVFDADRFYAFTAFNVLSDKIDVSGNHSVLGYELSGSSGNHILKIQFKNVGYDANRNLTYQIWLKENGNLVEVHIGPDDFHFINVSVTETISDSTGTRDTTYITQQVDTTNKYRIGLIDMNMDGDTDGLFIGGSSSSPSSALYDTEHQEVLYLDEAPSVGRRYVFTPSF